MQMTFDIEDLKPIIAEAVAQVLATVVNDDGMAFDEATAARKLGLERHQLRDERLRGRIQASVIVGGRIRYLKSDLLEYLAMRRTQKAIV